MTVLKGHSGARGCLGRGREYSSSQCQLEAQGRRHNVSQVVGETETSTPGGKQEVGGRTVFEVPLGSNLRLGASLVISQFPSGL